MTPAAVFEGRAEELRFEAASRAGAFVRALLPEPIARGRLLLGKLPRAQRLVACFRPEPFWMQPRVGTSVAEVPRGTQFLLVELDAGQVLLIAPLCAAPFKASLEGQDDGTLWLVLDSGDSAVTSAEALCAYIAEGDDPYTLCREGARAVAEALGTFTLRRDKPRPAFADYFGWCTWDAFYQDVSEAKLEQGLRALREGGVQPRFVILDDGWQSVTPVAGGAARLSAFTANAKFPDGLAACVSRVKREHGLRYFLVWHTIHGYWGGVDAAALDAYGVEEIERSYSEEVLAHFPTANHDYWGPRVGRPALSALERFYDDYHAELARAGVDGVKVDNQASVEGVASGQRGSLHAMQATHAALERSVQRHFGGELINCMSCSSEMFYADRSSALTRTSTDFWPERPETHGLHVHTNALVGLWFGELVHPDWDMFQSAHPAGAFHAAARAVSGSAVYVSDKPGQHDFELLAELTCSTGRVLAAEGVGVPARDSLFIDPVREARLFKVVNHNLHGGVIGIFNATLGQSLRGQVSPSDLPLQNGLEFALYLKRADRLVRLARRAEVEVELGPLSAEIATLAPLVGGVAVLGLSNKLNGGAAVRGLDAAPDWLELELCDGGDLLLLSERAPRLVTSDGEVVRYRWLNQRLDIALPKRGAQRVRVELAPVAR